MSEDLIHFVWKHKPSLIKGLIIDNQNIEVISAGDHNSDAGPDFFNSKIRIGNTVWAGNVEIHLKSSDWAKHGHCNNPAYDSVILHVVIQNDATTYNSKGDPVLTTEIEYPHALEEELRLLMSNHDWIPCAKQINQHGEFNTRLWLSNLAVERLEAKTSWVNNLVLELNGSWEEAFYVSVAKSFGLKINALPFELLAKATPLKCLAKVRNSILSIEALLFGQAGFLNPNDNITDKYICSLTKEYAYQKSKYGLNPIEGHLWKFLRLRPASFPTVRLSQFAQLIQRSSGLFSMCMEAASVEDIQKHFEVSTSDYWETHYTFSNESKRKVKTLGLESQRTIVLNSIIPFMFAYGERQASKTLKEKAVSFLEQMHPEKNATVTGFNNLGVKIDSAFLSQGAIQLKNQYCDKRKCLYCNIGANVLLKRIHP